MKRIQLSVYELELVRGEVMGAFQKRYGMAQDARLPMQYRDIFRVSAKTLHGVYIKLGGSLPPQKLSASYNHKEM